MDLNLIKINFFFLNCSNEWISKEAVMVRITLQNSVEKKNFLQESSDLAHPSTPTAVEM